MSYNNKNGLPNFRDSIVLQCVLPHPTGFEQFDFWHIQSKVASMKLLLTNLLLLQVLSFDLGAPYQWLSLSIL
jgi:hypothetical protein